MPSLFSFLRNKVPNWRDLRFWRVDGGSLGSRGEWAAVRYLKQLGMKIVVTNYKTRLGEIDIVALDGDCIVFVEVKTRQKSIKRSPAEAVDGRKQERLTRLGLAYLKEHGLLEQPARFDIVSVVWPEGEGTPRVEHHPNAFSAKRRKGQMFA